MSDPEVVPGTARKMWRTLEPYHGLVYFAPESRTAYEALGVDAADGYFVSRAAPMGAVRAEVVVATFFNFNPLAVERALPRAWDVTTPDDVVGARLAGADAALRRACGELLRQPDVEVAASSARQAALACAPQGRPLFAGHAALAWPDEPHLVLWHAITLLREYRGDGHVACLVEAGLDGLDALVLHAASGEVPRRILQATRQWDDGAWDVAVDGLARRGLVDGTGAFTTEGAELRQRIEDRTDELAVAPWRAIGAAACEELRSLVRPLSKAIVAGGGLSASVITANG